MNARHWLLAGLLTGASTAQAVTIFSDNFDADTLGLNYNAFLGGWTVSDGTVDLIGAPGFFDLHPGNGRYVDLDGSTSNAGVLSKSLMLTGGITYSATFDLGGSRRGDTNVVDVAFGSTLDSFTLLSADAYTSSTLMFTPGSSGLYTLSFANVGGDNLGAILDNVVVASQTAVIPEPSTYALMLGGLALVGALARRRGRA